MIAHIVLYRPKESSTDQDVRALANSFQAACRSIPSVRRARIGRIAKQSHVGPAVIGDTTYQAAAVIEFDDEAGLKSYLDHPAHAALALLFWKYCESTLVVDASLGDPTNTNIEQILGLTT